MKVRSVCLNILVNSMTLRSEFMIPGALKKYGDS